MVGVVDQFITKDFALYNGDSCEVLAGVPDNSIHYEIYSPPFANLYTYSNSERDLGNCKSNDEFFEHFKFIAQQLYRVLMPGRIMSVHCMDIPAMKERDGYIGLIDFPGQLIRMFEEIGFIYHSRVAIWKDPLVEATRTKALGLMHKQLCKDSAMCRNGLPDYLVSFRKPGDNTEPITHPDGLTSFAGENEPTGGSVYSHEVWRRYASPIWMDINQSRTLNREAAREQNDERHICLAEGSLILTARGYIPIEDVEIGDLTLTHTGAWNPIIAKKKTKQNADVVQVHAHGVPCLMLTPDHRIYARRKENYHNGKRGTNKNLCEPQWVEAQHTLAQYVNQKTPPTIESSISAQEWWIIGRWLADGHVDVRGKQFFISVGRKKLDEFMMMADGHIGHIAAHNELNCTQIGLVGLSNDARTVLKKCGTGAENKRIPLEAISLSVELSEALLSGYLSGDGCLTTSGNRQKWDCSSVSRALMLGMSLVVQKARGIAPSVYAGKKPCTKEIMGRTVQCKQVWVMAFQTHFRHKGGSASVNDDGAWKKVKRVEPAGQADVWSIQVEGDASFTAEGCIVKNCPLQLDTIERGLTLYTNPGDTVLTPFLGIGSEIYQALEMGRKGIGIELKASYYAQAVKNCKSVIASEQLTLEG